MCFVSRSEDDFGVISDDKFKKWKNGGGVFHESACIDSTAFLDVGAVVHSESVVGSNVRIGSGTVVGPSVVISHSVQIGYTFTFSILLCYVTLSSQFCFWFSTLDLEVIDGGCLLGNSHFAF